MNEKIKQFLNENNIKYQYINNKLRLYFSYESGHASEYELDLKRKIYSMGITTKDHTNMEEHAVLSKVFNLLGWL